MAVDPAYSGELGAREWRGKKAEEEEEESNASQSITPIEFILLFRCL